MSDQDITPTWNYRDVTEGGSCTSDWRQTEVRIAIKTRGFEKKIGSEHERIELKLGT
jgi:hypothetical protein